MGPEVMASRQSPVDSGITLGDIIDLSRYPIGASHSHEFRDLVAGARAHLGSIGAFVLEGFLREPAIAAILREADGLAAAAFVSSRPHNVYLTPSDPGFPGDHPRNRQVRSAKSVLADDEIPATSVLRLLYGNETFRAFLCRVLDVEGLFPFEDPLAPINLNFYGEGEELGWHFDNSPFAVTLLLRQAPQGGAFEFVPDVRQEGEAGHAAVGRILAGHSDGVRELKQDPGALVLFKGARSLHRVTPCRGAPPRTIAVLSYAPAPGQSLTNHTRHLFYGRSR